MVTLPIPSEQRADVFVVTPDADMERLWLRYGGESKFHYPGVADAATFCGVAIFKLVLAPHISRAHFNLLLPFFERAGRESNVFEFDVVRQLFVRRDEAWFESRVVDYITGCGYVSPSKLLLAGWFEQAGPTGPTGPTCDCGCGP